MKVFITGASGFIGKRVIKAVNRAGHKIVASRLVNDKTENTQNNIQWLYADLADLESFKPLLKYFNPEDIIVGYDHHFGFERQGDSEFLKEQKASYGYELHVKDPIKINNVPVSSTRIRNYLSQNNIKNANECLGWEYEITGIVMRGSGIGREIKFPTANIMPEIENQLIPAQGVYCVEVFVDGYSYIGMCNIGIRPTFHINGDKTIEVHIITDRELFLYDKRIKIKFKQFIRKEQKYDSAEDLTSQLQLDRQECLSI